MSGFNGTWKIDVARSSMWSVDENEYVPEVVGEEVISMHIDENRVQDYEVLYGDDPIIRMGYRTTFDNSEWAPYTVRSITPRAELPPEETLKKVAEFRERIKANYAGNSREFEVGKEYGMIRLIWADDRTHYRIQSTIDGEAQNVMMRRLSVDGSNYFSTLMDRDGIVFRKRVFVKAS